MVDLGEIQQMMNEYEPNPFVHALIDAANQNGVDNSTAISAFSRVFPHHYVDRSLRFRKR